MRITFIFSSSHEIILPINYLEYIQAMVYTYLEKDFAKFLHEEGYAHQKRKFKLFTFSNLTSPIGKAKFNPKDKSISFNKLVQFTLSTAIEKIAIDLIQNKMMQNQLWLGKNNIFLQSIQVHPPQSFGNKAIIKMISPMTVYSTLEKKDGKKKTYYYKPSEEDFVQLIKGNLIKKYEILFPNNDVNQIASAPFSLTAEKYNPKYNRRATLFKGTYIEGHTGTYLFSAHPGLIQTAYDTGLGSKNSCGFGCWEIIE